MLTVFTAGYEEKENNKFIQEDYDETQSNAEKYGLEQDTYTMMMLRTPVGKKTSVHKTRRLPHLSRTWQIGMYPSGDESPEI